MGLYEIIIRPFIKHLGLEKASRICLRYFKFVEIFSFRRLFSSKKSNILKKEVFGIQFNSPIGIGAGLDRKGELNGAWSELGCGFIEIGPINTDELKKIAHRLKNSKKSLKFGLCIAYDYLSSFTLAYDFCDFFVIDITSDPSTEYLDSLLEARIAEDYKPIVVKIPEFINSDELNDIVAYCLLNNVDGIEVQDIKQISRIHEISKGLLPIIANNHIDSLKTAIEVLDNGASLVEIRRGLVRQGPSFVKKITKALTKRYA